MKERMRVLMFKVETKLMKHRIDRETKRAEKLDNDMRRFFVKYKDIILVKCEKDPLMKEFAVDYMINAGILEQTKTQDDTQDVFDI